MAGHWIKWEKGLCRKPEIMQMAAQLNQSEQHTAACCMLVWEWADDITTEGLIKVTKDAVDKIAGQPGFAQAMVDAEWLVESATCIQFPNYERHNGNTAKKRMVEASRQLQYRLRKKQTNVTG